MKTNGPWKIIKSQKIYKNPWINVREDKVIQPNGKEGLCGIVEMLHGVFILPIDDKGYVYLIDQFRYVLGKNIIEIAGGSIKKGENIIKTAKRELREETGIIAKEFICLGKILPLTSVIKTSSTLYLAKKLKFVKAVPEETEKIKVIKVKLKDALKMVINNKINHAPSCILIFKANEYFTKGANK